MLYTLLEDDYVHVVKPTADLDLSIYEQASVSVRQALYHLDLTCKSGEDDLFAQGLDSLQIANLVRRIRIATGRADFSAKTIYLNPTINKLAFALSSDANKPSPNEPSREQNLEACLDSVSKNFPVVVRPLCQ